MNAPALPVESADMLATLVGDACSVQEMRERIFRLEAILKQGETIELPVKHHLSDGVYARELFIPKGVVLTGEIHRFAQINIISQGEISVSTDDGIRRLKAPCTIISPPGTKRVGYAHEDTIWTTIHPNPDNETDIDKLKARLIAPNFEALEGAAPLMLKEK